jgi:hypothetical protein
MQRFGKNGLPRMERVSAARGLRLRCILSSSGFGRAHGRKDRWKIFRRIIPSDLRPGRRGNCARRVNIPDGRRIQNHKHLQHGREREGILWEFLLNPAVAKVCVAEKFLWRRRPPNQRHQAGGKLLESSRPFQREPRSRQFWRRVERNSYIRPLMQMSDLEQAEWPPRNYTPSRLTAYQMQCGRTKQPLWTLALSIFLMRIAVWLAAIEKSGRLKSALLMACRPPHDLPR